MRSKRRALQEQHFQKSKVLSQYLARRFPHHSVTHVGRASPWQREGVGPTKDYAHTGVGALSRPPPPLLPHLPWSRPSFRFRQIRDYFPFLPATHASGRHQSCFLFSSLVIGDSRQEPAACVQIPCHPSSFTRLPDPWFLPLRMGSGLAPASWGGCEGS